MLRALCAVAISNLGVHMTLCTTSRPPARNYLSMRLMHFDLQAGGSLPGYALVQHAAFIFAGEALDAIEAAP